MGGTRLGERQLLQNLEQIAVLIRPQRNRLVGPLELFGDCGNFWRVAKDIVMRQQDPIRGRFANVFIIVPFDLDARNP